MIRIRHDRRAELFPNDDSDECYAGWRCIFSFPNESVEHFEIYS